MGIIYCIENLINNSKYVGLDSFEDDRRWKDHIRRSNYKNVIQLIDKKIKEYGLNNFKYTVLFKSNDLNELKANEQFFIKKLDTFVGNGKGYNLTFGGDNNPMDNPIVRQIHKKAMEEKTSGPNNYFYGKKRSLEYRLYLSLKLKGVNSGEKNPAKRPEVRKKISEKAKLRIGKLNSNFRHEIPKIDLYDYYVIRDKSLRETLLNFNCSEATIVRKLREFGIKKAPLIIDEELFYIYYIIENMTMNECSLIFECSFFPLKKIAKKRGWYKNEV